MGELWEGCDVRKEFLPDADGIRRGRYVLYINGKRHSDHDSLSKAEREFLLSKGKDPLKYRGK